MIGGRRAPFGLIYSVARGQHLSGAGYRIGVFLFSLAYAGFLSALPLFDFKDRDNYLVYAESSWNIIQRYWDVSSIAVLANEPIWLGINALLAMYFPPETVLRLIIFFPAFFVAKTTLLGGPRNYIWLLLLLLMPQVVKNHVIHLRQGVALGIFLVGWFSPHIWARRFLMVSSGFVHASFLFIVGLYALTKLLLRLKLAADIRQFVFSGVGVGVGLGLATVAHLVGARQAEQYSFTMTTVSGLGFAFWLMILIVFLFQGKKFLKLNAFEVSLVTFYLATYFFVEVTARIFESGLILVFLAGLQLSGWRRLVFLGSVLFYWALQWGLRLGQPDLGFAFA